MSLNLIEYGLSLQAASLGKGPVANESAATQENGRIGEPQVAVHTAPPASAADPAEPKPESQPQDYEEPMPQVCPSCNTKYWGFSCPRSACKE
jgi:hypothetical protein